MTHLYKRQTRILSFPRVLIGEVCPKLKTASEAAATATTTKTQTKVTPKNSSGKDRIMQQASRSLYVSWEGVRQKDSPESSRSLIHADFSAGGTGHAEKYANDETFGSVSRLGWRGDRSRKVNWSS